jgi:hypothetical protein
MRFNDQVHADLIQKVKTLAGPHYDTLMGEFCDLNDARVGTVREYMDLGIPRETAENILYYLRLVWQGIDPNLKTKYAEDVAGPMEDAA